MTLSDKLALHEGLVAKHEKKQAQHKSFFQRQLDRKESITQQLRAELDETKRKLTDTVRDQRAAGRQLLVDKVDMDTERARLSQTMARQVSKMTHFWNTVRDVKSRSKAKAIKDSACSQVSSLIFCLLAIFVECIFCLQALELRLAHVGARKNLAFQQKRQANKKIERQIRLLSKKKRAASANAQCEDIPLPFVPLLPLRTTLIVILGTGSPSLLVTCMCLAQ